MVRFHFAAVGAALSLVLLPMVSGGQAKEPQRYVAGELIVKMKGRPSGSKSQAFLGKVQNRASLKATYGRLNMHHLALKPGQDMQKAMEEMRQDPDVEYVEPNYILHKTDGETAGAGPQKFTADEMSAMAQQNYASGSYSQSGANTKVTQAWSQMSASSSEEPVVAVVDTGVDYTHNVFASSGAIWTNPGEIGTDAQGHNRSSNGIDDDGNGYVDDVRGWNFHDHSNNPMDDDDHGTHVSGIILGVTQDINANPLALAKIRIMPLKFLGADGSGSTSDAIQAIYYASNNGAQVINNSWGGASYSQALHDALKYAYDKGILITVAAGNNTNDNDANATWPANYPVPSLISVAATNDWDGLASFSNFGQRTVHMAAPGVSIYSTVPGNYFRSMSGTSMAAPFVAGLAAMAMREAPQLTGYQIRNIIVNAGDPISYIATKTVSGGRADSLATVSASKMEVGTQASQPAYTASAPAGYRDPASADSAAQAGGCGLVSTSVMNHTFNSKDPGGRGGDSQMPLAVGLTLLPLLVWQVVRSRAAAVAANGRRRHERFVMNSEIKVKVGDRELVGQMNTISMGGLSFKADALLEKGGVVTLQIASPDGGTQVSVEGAIVWSEENQSYGVQFAGAKDSVLQNIRGWTRDLVKAS